MSDIFSNIREFAALIRDVGLIIAVPVIFAVALKLYKQLVDIIKAENNVLRLTQYDQALSQIKAQKELFQLERERLEREVEMLREHGAEKDQELEITQRSLNMVEHKLQIIEEKRREISDQIYERESKKDMNTFGSTFETEILRKLRVWYSSESFGKPGTIIPDYLFISSTYGEVAVSQIEQQVMIRRGWIEEVNNGVRITEKGRQVASVK